MEIELRHLRIVSAIAEAGSISRAATMVGSTQPAVTRQLRRLESALGGALFERSARGAAPTALGTTVLARARAVLPVVDSLLSDTEHRLHADLEVQYLRVGSPVGPSLVPLLDAVRALAPRAQVGTDSEVRIDALRDLVAAGHLDAAVVHENVGFELDLPPTLQRLVLSTEPVFVLMSTDHPLAGEQEVSLADLADDPWVISPLDADREYEAFAEVCADAGFTPRIGHRLTGAPAVELVRNAGHVGLVYAMARAADVVAVPMREAPLRYRQLLLIDRRGKFAAVAEELAGRLRADLARMGRKHPVYGPWLQRHGPLRERVVYRRATDVPATDVPATDVPATDVAAAELAGGARVAATG